MMGPLQGLRVLELGGIGAVPFAGMLLSDLGADVIRIERSRQVSPMNRMDPSARGKQSIALNLKNPGAATAVLKIVSTVDAVIEGFRPGALERLGLGPEPCLKVNPALVFGRLTGWGQAGPLAQAAGHDINYIALNGALHAMGHSGGRPTIPLNLIGDMGGGGMLMALGVMAALLSARETGVGQVVDAAMTDGSALMMWMAHGFSAAGFHDPARPGTNLLDGGAPFYNTYATSDGKWVAVGALESPFFRELLQRLDITEFAPDEQMNPGTWAELSERLTETFKQRTRDEWCALLEGTDACFAPVLSLAEAPSHPQHAARGAYIEVDGFAQPAPAPRFSATPLCVRHGAKAPGEDSQQVLSEAGFTEEEIQALRDSGIVL